MTKVMISLPTSLLIFLAIELMVMRRNPTEFRKRFAAWVRGESPYEAGLKKYDDGKTPYRKGGDREYVWDEETQQWHRLDPIVEAFEAIVARPQKAGGNIKGTSRTEPVVWHDTRLDNAGYVTQSMLDEQRRWDSQHDSKGRLVAEPGLQIVSPEFDALMLGSAFRGNPLTQQLWKNRSLSKEMNKVFDEGLVGATKDMPVLKATDMYNPEHMLSTVKYNPKQIGVAAVADDVAEEVTPVISKEIKQISPRKYAELKTPDYIFDSEHLDTPLAPADLDVGLHEYILNRGKVNLFHGYPYRDPKTGLKTGLQSPIKTKKETEFWRNYFRPSGKAEKYFYRFNTNAEDVPEEVYDGRLSKLIVSKENLMRDIYGEPLKPRLALPEPKYGTYVDSEGNVNMRNVVKAVREFYKKHPEARDYKDVINYKNFDKNGNFIDRGNLYEHIRGVVKSAQEAPLPEGYTRQQFVQSALFHDIGKVLDPTKTHDKKSIQILKEMGIDVSPEVQTAIGRHMSSHLGNKDALSKALHFADVARGEPIETALSNYSYLGYPGMNKTQIKPLYKNDTKWQLENIINPILEKYGYYFTNDEYKKYGIRYVEGDPPIPSNVSPDVARKMVLDKIKQHRSFVRSLYEANGHDWENLRKQTAQQLGKDTKDVTNEDMFRNAAQYIKKKDTNSGTMGLDSYLDKYELNPKDFQALYSSSRDNTASGYRIGSRNGDSASYWLQMNINDDPKWSLAELWANNEFPIVYSSGHSYHGTDWRQYELPFRLNTGLDFNKEVKSQSADAEKFNRHALHQADVRAIDKAQKYFEEHPDELDPGLTYFKNTSPTTRLQAYYRIYNGQVNGKDLIEHWGTTDKYITDNEGRKTSAEYLQSIAYTENYSKNNGRAPRVANFTPSRIQLVNDILKENGLSEIYPIMSSDINTKDMIVKYPRAYSNFVNDVTEVSSMMDQYKEIYQNRDAFLYKYGSYRFDPNGWLGEEYVLEQIKNKNVEKEIVNKFVLQFISRLYKNKYLTKNQIQAINRELRSGKTVEEVGKKYIDEKTILQRLKNKYFSDIKQEKKIDAFLRRKQLNQAINEEQARKRAEKYIEFYEQPKLKHVKSKAEIMKEYGVDPDYSYMSPDGYRIFSTERLDNPDPNDVLGNHYVVVGPRGSKQLNIVGEWEPTVDHRSHGHGGKYIRGASRNLGASIIAIGTGATTLKPRRKEK